MLGLLQAVDTIISQIPEPKLFKGFNGYYKEAEDEVRKQYPYMESLNQESFRFMVNKVYREKIWSPSEEKTRNDES